MKNTTYNTGRDYGAPQVLDITYPAERYDMVGFDYVEVDFRDAARNIAGRVRLFQCELRPQDVGPAVKREYDHGRYQLLDI